MTVRTLGDNREPTNAAFMFIAVIERKEPEDKNKKNNKKQNHNQKYKKKKERQRSVGRKSRCKWRVESAER